jgi:hypothetical protein
LSKLSIDPDELIVDNFAGGVFGLPFDVPGACACQYCGSPFIQNRSRNKRHCSDECRVASLRRHHELPPLRPCRICGAIFLRTGRGHANKQHCSPECAGASARAVRARFKQRRPERVATYRERQRAKRRRDTSLVRLWRKHPEVPKECEACGESRVLDIAHRPEYQRRGAWRTMSNTMPHQIFVLCPTCHALLDRLGYSEEQLGIKPRKSST